jgi:hypothetical protein
VIDASSFKQHWPDAKHQGNGQLRNAFKRYRNGASKAEGAASTLFRQAYVPVAWWFWRAGGNKHLDNECLAISQPERNPAARREDRRPFPGETRAGFLLRPAAICAEGIWWPQNKAISTLRVFSDPGDSNETSDGQCRTTATTPATYKWTSSEITQTMSAFRKRRMQSGAEKEPIHIAILR